MRSALGAAGISVAIPALTFHRFFTRRVDDLVLTMDDANLSAVRSLSDEMGGRATAELKTMLSFARNFTETEVPDPYYGGEAGFEHVLDLLEDSCSALLDEFTAGE